MRAILSAGTAAVALLGSVPFAIAQPRQQDQVITENASAPARSDACSSSIDKAFGRCMAQGLTNIKTVTCDCTQRGPSEAPTWECTGIASCTK